MDDDTNINIQKQEKSILFKLKNSAFVKRLLAIKNIKAIAAVILFIIVALIVINVDFTSKKTTTASTSKDTNTTSYTSSKQYVNDLEQKLTSILSCIKGAGHTEVMITIENGPEIVIANNVEQKTTTTGSGNTVTVVTTPILIDVAGESVPLVTMEIVPKVKGVLVVSAGANDVRVRLDMLYAIQALLDVDKDNIQIFVGS